MSHFKIDIQRQLDKALERMDKLEAINRHHMLDRTQILSTNEALREENTNLLRNITNLGNELSSALIDVNTLNIELYGRPSKPR